MVCSNVHVHVTFYSHIHMHVTGIHGLFTCPCARDILFTYPYARDRFTCHHGNIHIPASDEPKLRQIPLSVWDALVATYKGGPRIDSVCECAKCVAEREEMDRCIRICMYDVM
jgi:hypothetical protein